MEAVKPVYLDYAATAPLCEEAAEAMMPFLVPGPANIVLNGNANSLYGFGRSAFQALEAARKQLARVVGARPPELIFTSGATEADNAALFGIAHAETARRCQAGTGAFKPRVVTTEIEHHAVLSPAKRLEREGYDVVRIRPDRAGFVDPSALSAVLSPQTVLVSIQMANSEIGSIQPIRALAECAHRCGARFHTDATQAFGKVPVDVAQLGVDAASFSSHKVGGPKGMGLLYVKSGVPFEAQMVGGGQESHRRSGTQNVVGAVGFAAAAQAAVSRVSQESARLSRLRDRLYAEFEGFGCVVPTVPVAARREDYLPSIVHVMVRGMESETLVLRLDNLGINVSGGSACSSHALDPSHVLTALGIQSDLALDALRISMGRYTEESDIERFLEAFATIIG